MSDSVRYVIFRQGSNGANQHRQLTMPVAVYEASGADATDRKSKALELAGALPFRVAGCWNNQQLVARPATQCKRVDIDAAFENMQQDHSEY